MKNRTKLKRFFATLRMTSKRAVFTLAELPEAGQHGSKQAAFTLAEVLITLGIIGVVAAMTIPTLIQKHEEKVTVVKVKKMYSTLSQAYLMNKAKDEIVLENIQSDDANAAKEVAAIFVPYLKIAKDCGTTQSGCMFDGYYKYKRGENYAKYDVNGSYSAYRVLLQDGSSIWFRRTTSMNSRIFYDVNGNNSPNTWGKDLFYFQVIDDKIQPVEGFESACKSTSSSGLGCTEWIIKVGNMDYLHCDDLSWNGKHTCK